MQEEAADPDRDARHTVYPEPSLIVSTLILPVGLGSAAHSRGRAPEITPRDRVWPATSVLNENNMGFKV